MIINPHDPKVNCPIGLSRTGATAVVDSATLVSSTETPIAVSLISPRSIVAQPVQLDVSLKEELLLISIGGALTITLVDPITVELACGTN